MTISSTTRKAGPYIGNGTASVFPFAFKVFQASDVEVVRLTVATNIETTLALTTDYTVSLNQDQDSNPGGSITLVAGALATGYNLVITSDVENLQPTDLTNQGGFYPDVINDALDRATIQIQQLQEGLDRAALLPITSSADAASLVADIVRLADSADNLDIDANNIGSINTVATNIANVNTTASNIASVNTTAGSIANVNATAANITNVNAVGADLLEPVSEINTVATSITNVNTVGDNIASVNTVAGNNSNVTTVAGSIANVNTVGGAIANVNVTATNIANVNAVGSDLLEPVSEINTVATDIANVNAVGNNISNVNTVAGINANVTTVAGISSNVTTVATNNANVTTVATNISNVNAVAGNNANVTAVAGNATNINAVAGNATNINAVNANKTNIDTVAANNSNVTTVATNISSVNNVSANIDEVHSFADVYQGAFDNAHIPAVRTNGGGALQLGDLYFNTSDNAMKVYSATGWIAAGSSVNGTSRRFRYIATAGQTTFSGSDSNGNTMAYDAGFVDVYLNGVRLDQTDYTASSGSSIVLASAAALSDEINIVAFGTFTVASMNGVDLINGTVSANKLAAGAAVSNIGYTPVNKAGDTITGRTIVSVATGKQLTLAQWGDASSADGGQAMIAGNAYFDKTGGQAKFSNSHGTIGAVGIRFNSPSWNEGSLFTSGGAGSTADATFTPVDALKWDTSGRVTMPYQPMASVNFGNSGTTTSGVYELVYTSVLVNVGSHYNSSNGRFTCPVAGIYRVSAFGMGQLISGDHNFYVTVRKNGSQQGATAYNYGGPTDYKHASGNWLVSCAAGDYLSIFVGGSSGYYGDGYQGATFQLVG